MRDEQPKVTTVKDIVIIVAMLNKRHTQGDEARIYDEQLER